ncbi:UDP-N-acetylmuramoylalanine--D-glutamate ligase [Halomonadaceae bacterium LMG 33818]|uniref:UDP-N-acetylmuramoyl-L-alanine--D-glutamate ligase n=1 Tax=Cernens ardua TaxID=3402176 RepID=UPI003EDBB3B0
MEVHTPNVAAEHNEAAELFPRTGRVPKGYRLVVGMGISGRAIARHLLRLGEPFAMADSRSAPPGLEAWRRDFPVTQTYAGEFLGDLGRLDLSQAYEVIVSPGVDPNQAAFDNVRDRLIGELDLFARAVPESAQVVAITGSNAKSTVTTLVGEMAQACGLDVGVGGNLGTATLTLLEEHHAVYVLELSSFQLEMSHLLAPTVACFLNLSEDHLDRHGDMIGYRAAKLNIFHHAHAAVANIDDSATWPVSDAMPTTWFTTRSPIEGTNELTRAGRTAGDVWGLNKQAGSATALVHNDVDWLESTDLHVAGEHNLANVLAALAIGASMKWPKAPMLEAVKHFTGLPHRAERLGCYHGIDFINDSKGTNVGASLAALRGITPTLSGKLLWLGGGVGKGQDFSPLLEPLMAHRSNVFLFGQDASKIQQALVSHPSVTVVNTLQEALEKALEIAESGDAILLSPACASLDQFRNYQARGDAFRDWFEQLDEVTSSTEKECR